MSHLPPTMMIYSRQMLILVTTSQPCTCSTSQHDLSQDGNLDDLESEVPSDSYLVAMVSTAGHVARATLISRRTSLLPSWPRLIEATAVGSISSSTSSGSYAQTPILSFLNRLKSSR